MTVAIIANGEKISAARVRRIVGQADILVAADGGANACREYDIYPHYIIGDLDSCSRSVQEHFRDAEVIPRPAQDATDMEKALEFAMALHPDRLIILSAFGQRKDHGIANLLFISGYAGRIGIEVYDEFGRLQILPPGRHLLQGRRGKTVSFVSLYPVKGLTLSGFRYPLENADFNDFFVGISNVVESDNGYVELASGKLILYEVCDDAL